jgi:hypothetical protein
LIEPIALKRLRSPTCAPDARPTTGAAYQTLQTP